MYIKSVVSSNCYSIILCLLLVFIGACEEKKNKNEDDFLKCDVERTTCMEDVKVCQQDKENCTEASALCTQQAEELEDQLDLCIDQSKLCQNDSRRCDGNLFQICQDGLWVTEQDCGVENCGMQDQALGCIIPDCVPQCGNRVCGIEPTCGSLCGTCNEFEECTAEGACRDIDIFKKLKSIQRFTGVEELNTSLEGHRAFLVKIRQPLDHDNLLKGTFNQRFILIHHSSEAPMTLMTTGYGLFVKPQFWVNFQDEVSLLLGSNTIILEHRYFEESIPDHDSPEQLDWSYLTIYQSASDSHRILETLKPIYPGAWVGTGNSKGGMTAIFHRHFYPNDLAGIVPYVAPISFGIYDTRYDAFLNTIGPKDGVCRERLKTISVDIVEARETLAGLWVDIYPDLSVFNPAVIAVTVAAYTPSLVWNSWQYYGSQAFCDALPPEGSSASEIFPYTTFSAMYLVDTGDPYQTYSYQVYAELGGPYYSTAYLDEALQDVDFSLLPQRQYPSWYLNPPTFNPDAMIEVSHALKLEAENVVGIYGEYDPWTAGMITVNESLGSKIFVAPGLSHGAGITHLTHEDQQEAIARIEAMVSTEDLAFATTDHAPFEQMKTNHAWYNKILAKQEAKAFIALQHLLLETQKADR